MVLKIVGAILIVISCGGVGFKIAANCRCDENGLEQLVKILDFMHCELQYRLTPLPNLCKLVAADFHNMIGHIFEELAKEMELQNSHNIGQCITSIIASKKNIPTMTRKQMLQLGNSLGRYDLEGQLKGLEAVQKDSLRILNEMRNNRDVRLRSYQTLGLCAGAALAILFI